jgi:predicted alpha/beta hydrolase family esterase
VATQILVIHGVGKPAMRRGSVYWKAKLEDALGAEYSVTCPIMPDPQYAAWRARIEEAVSQMEDGLILVGHSLGGSLERTVAGLFVLAAPYWSKETKWESDEFRLPDDFTARLRVPRIFLYHSRDDEEVPFAHLSCYAERLPQAAVRALDGQGHEFRDLETPELTRDIRTVGAGVMPRTGSNR